MKEGVPADGLLLASGLMFDIAPDPPQQGSAKCRGHDRSHEQIRWLRAVVRRRAEAWPVAAAANSGFHRPSAPANQWGISTKPPDDMMTKCRVKTVRLAKHSGATRLAAGRPPTHHNNTLPDAVVHDKQPVCRRGPGGKPFLQTPRTRQQGHNYPEVMAAAILTRVCPQHRALNALKWDVDPG